MRELDAGLAAHFATGATTICRCWQVTRKDGHVLGFTDHDRDLAFGGVTFRAGTGLDAAAIQSSTGLSVDNSQAVGALNDQALREDDIRAGRYDGAEVLAWQVNWAAVEQRILVFRGSIGEIRRAGGAFEAELRGLAEALNRPMGRAFHRSCPAVLGDAACGFDLGIAGYVHDSTGATADGRGVLVFAGLFDFEPGWFSHGVLRVLDGVNAGAVSSIRRDRFEGDMRLIELWQDLPFDHEVGATLRLEAGCDKRAETCRLKFSNLLNFRGFPHIPGDDWAMAYPTQSGQNDGGSLTS